MYQQRSAFSGLLLVAAITVGCGGPSNSDIDAKVKTKLKADEAVAAADINVGVQKKVVTLTGTVDTPAIKERAVAVARGTDRVTEVVDQMTMRQHGGAPVLDAVAT